MRQRRCPHHGAPHGARTRYPHSSSTHVLPRRVWKAPVRETLGSWKLKGHFQRCHSPHGQGQIRSIIFGFFLGNIPSGRTGPDSPEESSTDQQCCKKHRPLLEAAPATRANTTKAQQKAYGSRYLKFNALFNVLGWIWGILELPTHVSAHRGFKQQLKGRCGAAGTQRNLGSHGTAFVPTQGQGSGAGHASLQPPSETRALHGAGGTLSSW